MAYTREQIVAGEGFFASGERTLVYRRPDGLYVTASRSERPAGNLTLVGGGHLQPARRTDGKRLTQIDWCE